MSFEQKTCFIAVCDDCGEEYENGEFTPHWDSDGEGIDEAVGMGDWWHDGKNVLLCRDCKEKPHDFVPSALNADDCDRCPHPADEHEVSGEGGSA